MQGFYWNSHPGDVSDNLNGGIWWDSLAMVSTQLADAGFQTVWTPPPTKGFGGVWDMGYGIKDYYDLGEFNQNGSIRTRHGSRVQFDSMVSALHQSGLKVMVDIVLNHRGGSDGQNQAYDFNGGIFSGVQPWTIFNPASGRAPGDSADFHPSQFHQDQNADYHNAIFFEDICYFNNGDTIAPPGGWYFGPPTSLQIGPIGDSLISWGRWLVDEKGIDELRLDAVKHIDPWFLAKFLVEVNAGNQPFAVGESFDYSTGNLENYQNAVSSSPNSGTKPAELSMFDFPLRGILKNILNDGGGGQDLYNQLGGGGLVWGSALNGLQVVTWIENHDTDRIGFEGGAGSPPCAPGEIQYGNSCLKIAGGSASDHDPVFQDKEDMGYPLIMAAEGRPMVFWKDWFWYGLADDIKWQMALRLATAQGTSNHIQDLNGFWPTDPPYDGDNHGGNMFAMRRNGLTAGMSDGMVLGLNDHPSKTNGVWVDAPFGNKYLKDYSDGHLFVSTQVFNDSSTFVKAGPRDYSWWSMTGLYPHPPEVRNSYFTMNALPGGAPHFIALDAGNAASFLVDGNPISPGDEVAIFNTLDEVVGIGRVGQEFGWNGTHDMIIEAIGPFPTDTDPAGGGANGMAAGEKFRVAVWDASMNSLYVADSVSYANTGTAFMFDPLRSNSPNRNGNFSSFSITPDQQGAFAVNGISRVLSFDANIPVVVGIESGITENPSPIIAPNPVQDQLTIRFDLLKPQSVRVTLLNLLGQEMDVLYSGKLDRGKPSLDLDVAAIPLGIYILAIEQGGKNKRFRLVKEE